MWKLSDFDYTLPKELIAQYPLKERPQARLMVLNRKDSRIEHRIFSDLPQYLKKNDLLILNDTKVLPVRLEGRRVTGGKVEILLLKRKEGLIFEALLKPARLKIGESIIFNGGAVSANITARGEVSFSIPGGSAEDVYKLGKTPLPPYIKREPEDLDRIYYQTVYAKEAGSIASPTAGLHFSEELIKRVASLGINIAYLTLHISYSTFKPIEVEDIANHRMEKESFTIPEETKELIAKTRRSAGRIIAVGTTSLRALEVSGAGTPEGETDLFIYPGYDLKIADCLLTNFHLPRTTLFLLACAFAGREFIFQAYREAIKEKYRFYSYGDAMLII